MAFDFSQITVPFRMQPGLRRVAPGSPQLTPALPGCRHLREKMNALATRAGRIFLCVPEFDAAPVLATLAGESTRHGQSAFTGDGHSRWTAPLLAWTVAGNEVTGSGDAVIGRTLTALPAKQRPAGLACLAFEEDFAVIDGADTTVRWLAVCLPSRWSPEEKIGKSFAGVHAPVADSALLIAAGEHLARLVTGGDRWERAVWTVSADPRLDQHPARGAARWPVEADADTVARLASFRHERQTFIPLADSTRAVFTIRVDSEPLVDALTTGADAGRLHDALASMSATVLAYRGLSPVRDRLLDWLARRANGSIATRP